MRYRDVLLASLLLLSASVVHTAPQLSSADIVKPEVWTAEIPKELVGPYIADPVTLAALDNPGHGCGDAGALYFQCLIYRDDRATMTPQDLASNPFEGRVFEEVRDKVGADLRSQVSSHLPEGFLKFAGAKIELVGVVNRMDRQFNRDLVPGHDKPLACGEISAIYRFGYKGSLTQGPPDDRTYASRLPVTMNVVFPAQPWSGSPDCRSVARRWLAYANAIREGADSATLLAQARQLVSSLRPEDIDRIELNMQGSRASASDDISNDFGTKATYIIRVFRWVPGGKGIGLWRASYLTNQIDRARLLGNDQGDDNTCDDQKGKKITPAALAAFLFTMEDSKKDKNAKNAFGDIDYGLVNIPKEFLACRAVSISPGGASRSGNQPFWDGPDNPILSNDRIQEGIDEYRRRYPNTLNFIGNPEEFRMRLNEASCSGCHQSRAIAGFHFPGADRPGTAAVNAIYLPGSAHFFGDQPRRMEILEAIANLPPGKEFPRRLLAASYAMRPQNSYRELRPNGAAKIQLVAGWGGACLSEQKASDVRQWGCESDLVCQPVFASRNQRGIGMCLNPHDQHKIGDVMQFGTVTSTRFGNDRYNRTQPLNDDRDDTRISVAGLIPPSGNSYIASHQEYFDGDREIGPLPGETAEQHARRVLEQQTGGFPGGSLRLGQCTNLPGEATCGLLASSGFTACLREVQGGKRTAESCFRIYTSYSGVRACDASNPCRDDYICMSPMGYTPANAGPLYDQRTRARETERQSFAEGSERRKVFDLRFFGEGRPDDTWLRSFGGRGDRRGVCIPPYFVFQFKADGHAVPNNP